LNVSPTEEFEYHIIAGLAHQNIKSGSDFTRNAVLRDKLFQKRFSEITIILQLQPMRSSYTAADNRD